MTDDSTVSRFILRRGAIRGTWMVWDRKIRGPARLRLSWATGFSEEQALETLAKLKLAHGEKPLRTPDEIFQKTNKPT